MEEIDPESLAEVAYGIFEIFLDRELGAHGPYLFERVEQGTDFEADVREIFGRFREDYPALAEALLLRFGGIDTVYAEILAGEGILPSKTTRMYWIVQDEPGPAARGLDDEQVGKWLIFVPRSEVDEAWRKIRTRRRAGCSGYRRKSAPPNRTPTHATSGRSSMSTPGTGRTRLT